MYIWYIHSSILFLVFFLIIILLLPHSLLPSATSCILIWFSKAVVYSTKDGECARVTRMRAPLTLRLHFLYSIVPSIFIVFLADILSYSSHICRHPRSISPTLFVSSSWLFWLLPLLYATRRQSERTQTLTLANPNPIKFIMHEWDGGLCWWCIQHDIICT